MRLDRNPGQIVAAPVIVVGGGQSGLAAGRALLELGMPALILEARDRAVGSWPRYSDSLRSFSPVEFSSMPGLPFPGAPGHYPHRDEVADYLEAYSAGLGVEIQTNTRVETIQEDGGRFVVCTADGQSLPASGIVAATGSFDSPFRPTLSGERNFTAKLLHVAEYGNPAPYVGQRVVVVGAGDSAVQVASELASVSKVTLATRKPVRFIPQRLRGKDVHYWFRETGFDALPPEWLAKITGGTVATDSGGYEEELAQGRFDRRPMFDRLDGDRVVWSDGQNESVDAIILATGYRPSVDYLRELGALDEHGAPIHVGGISSTHLGLVYVGIEFQRSYASNTLRGVMQDARAVIGPLVAWIRDAPAAIGLPESGLARKFTTALELQRTSPPSFKQGVELDRLRP
jgi:putative flavoprotein involved in K+ transport